jgi:hypothetical protein
MDSNSRVRESLIDFMRRLSEMAKESAAHASANSDDKRTLEDEAERLISSVESLIKNIEMHEAYVLLMSGDAWEALGPEDQAKLGALGPFDPLGLVDLSSALFAAFRLGGYVLENPIMKRAEKELREAAAAHARHALESTSKKIDDLIVREVSLHWSRHPEKSPEWLASEILEPVNNVIKEEKLRPKPLGIDAIRKRLEAKGIGKRRHTEKS